MNLLTAMGLVAIVVASAIGAGVVFTRLAMAHPAALSPPPVADQVHSLTGCCDKR